MTSAPIITARRGTPAVWLIHYLETQGLSVDHICHALDLDESQLISDSGIMPVRTYMSLLKWASRELNAPLLGVELAQAIKPHEYGIIGHLTKNARTLREVFEFLEKYHCIYSPEFQFRFNYSESTGKCQYRVVGIESDEARVDIDFSLAIIMMYLKACAGDDWFPLRCTFAYPQPNNVDIYRTFFGESVFFDQPKNAIEFEMELIETANQEADLGLLPILLNQANQLLDTLQVNDDIVHKTQLLITASLGYKPVSTESVADHLHISVRHLHRLLKERGTSFRKIKEETILEAAKESLIGSDLSVTEIAQKLGYSETSALARLFKKHTGHAPLKYRQQFSG